VRKIIAPLLIIFVLTAVTIIIIAVGRGYKPNIDKKTLSATGLLVASSEPQGAQVWIDGELQTATNNTLALLPNWYQVKIIKEGYTPWEKRIRVQGEVVSETRALLFPSNPTLSPQTNTGVVAPSVSPDGTKIIYAVPKTSSKAGLWLLGLMTSPLGFRQDPQLMAQNSATIDFSAGTFSWSPDSKKILITIGGNHYLLDSDKNSPMTTLGYEEWQNLIKTWQDDSKEKELKKLAILPEEFAKIATTSAKIIAYSPDETKILFQGLSDTTLAQILSPAPIATNSTPETRDIKSEYLYVYDIKEDKNFQIPMVAGALAESLSWLPSSRHLILVGPHDISTLEYDGTNKNTIYSGPFEKFVACLPSGEKMLVLTNLNQPSSGILNLYFINLR
jgi:hypothetical protein